VEINTVNDYTLLVLRFFYAVRHAYSCLDSRRITERVYPILKQGNLILRGS